MIDIHCHIIPGVDDGASSLTESIVMAKEAYKQGIRTIIATPSHHGQFDNPGQHISAQVEHLNATLQHENINIEILPGQVTSIHGDLLADIKKGDVLTLNEQSSRVLIKLPNDHIPHYTTNLLYEMLMAGYKPIIANPELNQEFHANPTKLYQFVKNGALTHVSANSVVGKHGKKVGNFTHQLLGNGLTHFVASSSKGLKKGGFNMKGAYKQITKAFGPVFSEQLIMNSQSIVTGADIHREQPSRIKPHRIFTLFNR